MNRGLSLYLDAVRLTAALVVFFSHIAGERFTGGLFWQAGPYGNEAVDIFFVLSGFVIAFVVDRNERSASQYASARLARVYSVALPALLLTFVLDAIGRSLRPEIYNASWGYVADGQGWQFLTSLFFVNRLWWSLTEQGSNLPYWSLSYEVWYYIIFGLAVFSPKRLRVPATAAAVLIAGPNIIALFPLWLLGVWCFRICKRRPFPEYVGASLWIGSIVLFVVYEIWARHRPMPVPFPVAWLPRSPRIYQDYAVAAIFAANLIGFHAISGRITPSGRIVSSIRWASGATFTIYLFHLPIAQLLASIVPWPPSSPATRIVMFPVLLAILFLIAQVTEGSKDWWRRRFVAIISWLSAGRRAAAA